MSLRKTTPGIVSVTLALAIGSGSAGWAWADEASVADIGNEGAAAATADALPAGNAQPAETTAPEPAATPADPAACPPPADESPATPAPDPGTGSPADVPVISDDQAVAGPEDLSPTVEGEVAASAGEGGAAGDAEPADPTAPEDVPATPENEDGGPTLSEQPAIDSENIASAGAAPDPGTIVETEGDAEPAVPTDGDGEPSASTDGTPETPSPDDSHEDGTETAPDGTGEDASGETEGAPAGETPGETDEAADAPQAGSDGTLADDADGSDATEEGTAPDNGTALLAEDAAASGWITTDGERYYYQNGKAVTGECLIDGSWYYLDPNEGGAMQTGFVRQAVSTGSGSFKVAYYGSDGKRLAGLQQIDGETYYFAADGALTAGFVRPEANGDIYYFLPGDGTQALGELLVHGGWRNFDTAKDGAMSTGFTDIDSGTESKTVYYDPLDGSMEYGEQNIGDGWYYFDTTTGAMATGWKWLDNGAKMVYYGPDGKMFHGEHVIDGYLRVFDMVTGAVNKYGYQNPMGYYQVSTWNVSLPSWQYGTGFDYVTPSQIGLAADRWDCIDTFINTAYSYIGTRYIWDYALAPGVGVDCAGLVMQCLYATGMDLGWYTPYDHYYTAGHDQYANAMSRDTHFMTVSFADRQRGDLIFYSGHVAIYIGNDQVIDAWPDGTGVQIRNLWHYTPNYIVKRPFV